MSEDQFLQAVVNLGKMYGWMSAHHNMSARKVGNVYISNITGDKGSPDLLMVRPPRVLLVELKTGTKYGNVKGHQSSYGLTKEQRAWRDALLACPGVEYFLWTPANIEEIAATLMRT